MVVVSLSRVSFRATALTLFTAMTAIGCGALACTDRAEQETSSCTLAPSGQCDEITINPGADGRAASLVGLDLRNATFRRADLSHAFIQGANFERANLEGAHLIGVNADRKTSFRGAVLRSVDFSGATLDGADFSGADLTRVQLTALPASNFSNANLTAVSFHEPMDCIAPVGANFDGAICPDGVRGLTGHEGCKGHCLPVLRRRSPSQ